MMKATIERFLAVTFGTLLLVSYASGQNARNTPRPAQIDEVIKLSKAGISEEIIISRIDKRIDLTTEEILEMKKAGVSDRVILWMTTNSDSTKPAITSTAIEVSEVGFYLLNGNQYIGLPTSAFTTQKAGMTRWIMTSGLGKTKQKANVPSASATVRSNSRQPSFLFYGPEGIAATDYILIRLDKKKDSREITVGQSNILGSSVGFEKDRIMDISITKLGPRRWTIKSNAPLQPGEYAFYPASGVQPSGLGVSAAGKLYEFGID
jgi:hypothetical protein